MSAATTTRVDDLLPMVAARAPEIENGRRVPRDLLDELKAAGCFRLLVPTSHGSRTVPGLTADAPVQVNLGRTLQ